MDEWSKYLEEAITVSRTDLSDDEVKERLQALERYIDGFYGDDGTLEPVGTLGSVPHEAGQAGV